MNKIESVIMPLKSDAMQRAEQEATALVKRYIDKLEEANFDLNIAAPYPKSTIGRNSYMIAMSKRQTYNMLVKHVKSSRSHGEPDIVEVSAERVANFINMAKVDAAAQYESFVAKLVDKIGEVTEAKLTGNHVWSFSILSVTKPDTTQENWKTQMIVNVSKLGKLFNQWPTRKVKNTPTKPHGA